MFSPQRKIRSCENLHQEKVTTDSAPAFVTKTDKI